MFSHQIVFAVVLVAVVQADPWLSTRVRVKANFSRGDEMFLLGGFDPANVAGCPPNVDPNNKCIMPIRHNNVPTNTSRLTPHDRKKYLDMCVNDNYLDWYGEEPNQGSYKKLKALGTPMFFLPAELFNATLNQTKKDPKPTVKPSAVQTGFFIAEFQMDCGRASGSERWFEFIPVRRLANGQVTRMAPAPYGVIKDLYSGTAGLLFFPPWDAGNYWGVCGRSSTVEWNVAGTNLSSLVLTGGH